MTDVRGFNPRQPRDPGGEGGGQWVKNPVGAAADAAKNAVKDAASDLNADELDIGWQIELNPDEHLVASDVFYQRKAEYELNAAVIKNRDGHEVRLGVTHEDDSWPGDSTDTLHLESAQFRKFHADVANAASEGKKAAADAQKAWDNGAAPKDPRLTGAQAVAEGSVSDGGTDLNWDVYVTDDDPISWQLNLSVEDGGELTLAPRDTAKLLKFLQGIDAHLAAPDASRDIGGQEAAMLTRAFQPEDHPRAPAGSDTGGQFAKAVGSAKKSAAGAMKSHHRKPTGRPARKPDDGTLSYDPQADHGTGYGSHDGDPRVHDLQQALNRLGVKDSNGKPLKDDGRLGPKTTSAVKALQQRLGMNADGKVTPALLAQIKSMKSLPAQKRSDAMGVCIRSFGFEPDERSRAGDGRTLEGYAAVFNSPARIRDLNGDFEETILPGAFKRTLGERTPILQWDHGKDPRIGTAPIGDIEELREDDHGLYVRARLYDHPDIERIRMAIAGRSVKGMSFRFGVPKGGDDWPTRDQRTIRDLDAYELGPVAFPAYDTTSVSVRSLLAQLDPDEHRSLIRELAAELRLAVDLSDLTGASGARSADRGDIDLEAPSSGGRSALSPEVRALEVEALHALGVL